MKTIIQITKCTFPAIAGKEMPPKNSFIMKYLFFAILLVSLYHVNAQTHQGDMWLTGSVYGNTVTFDNGIVTTDTNHNFLNKYFALGHSNICNSNGRLILASAGYDVYDSLGNTIDGGDTLVSNLMYQQEAGFSAFAQSSLFLPFSDSVYYFIVPNTTDAVYANWYSTPFVHKAFFDQLFFYKIDMKANNGAGKVVSREIVLDSVTMMRTMMQAVRHANGTDWWLLKQMYADRGTFNGPYPQSMNIVAKIRIAKDSIYPVIYDTMPDPWFPFFEQSGQLMFNETGSQYAVTARGMNKVFLADFDRCDGTVSNGKVYSVPNDVCHEPVSSGCIDSFTQGLSFSPDGRFLYVLKFFNIFQLDLQDNDSSTAWYQVAGLDTTWQAFQEYSSAAIGSDGKIYVGNKNGLSAQMSVIANPNNKGVACNFCPRCLRFPYYGASTPPNMPNYDLGAKLCAPQSNGSVTMDNEQLLIYPNPTNGVLYLESELFSTEKTTFSMYNLQGQKVQSGSFDKGGRRNSINVSGNSPGLYMLEVNAKEQQWMQKVVVE